MEKTTVISDDNTCVSGTFPKSVFQSYVLCLWRKCRVYI